MLLKGLEGMPCEEQLRALALSSLEQRRLTSDLIVLCSFLRGGSGRRDSELFFMVSSVRKHGNGSKLCQERFRLDIRNYFFIVRLVKH